MIFNSYAEQKTERDGVRLVSCGHIFAKPGREIHRPRGREDWLLFYIAADSETFYLQKPCTGSPGSFVLYAPGEKQHHRYNGTGTGEFYYIHFRADRLPAGSGLTTSRLYDLPFSRQICDLFEEILEELRQKPLFYEELCLYRLFYLLTLLERGVQKSQLPPVKSHEQIGRVVQHMNRFYDRPLRLEDYAAMANMSKYHFLRVFEETVGATPLEYRNRIRLEHAAALLLEEQLSVEEVARTVGYSTAAYFSSAFKQKYGLSPKQFQRQKAVDFLE